MGNCLPLCTGNLPKLTSTYSGTITITCQPGLVLSTSSPTEPKQYAAILSSPQREDPPHECTNLIQLPQMGFGQSGEKAQQTFQ